MSSPERTCRERFAGALGAVLCESSIKDRPVLDVNGLVALEVPSRTQISETDMRVMVCGGQGSKTVGSGHAHVSRSKYGLLLVVEKDAWSRYTEGASARNLLISYRLDLWAVFPFMCTIGACKDQTRAMPGAWQEIPVKACASHVSAI